MPITVEKPIQAKNVRVGYEIIFPGSTYAELVADVADKTKYAYISTDYGETKIERDTELTWVAQEPTEEEVAEQTRQRAIDWATESLERAQNRLTEAKNKLVEALQMRDVSWHGRYWANYAEAQMELGLWEYVHTVSEKREIDLHDALIRVRDEITKRLLDLGHFLPRSTDMLRNYCDGLEAEVRLRFIRDIEWRTGWPAT